MTKRAIERRAAIAAFCIFASTPAFADVFVNEIHYDNDGTDANERVEIAAPAGTSLAGWKLSLYNGSDGTVYATINLAGTIPNQCGGHGTLAFNAAGLQNGAPDGLALVNASGGVVQLVSYEGAFTATGGPAAGRVASDIGRSEGTGVTASQSLQLRGTGTRYADFAWAAASTSSFGACNSGQTFSGGGSGGDPYYDGVDTSSAANLRSTLHAIISHSVKIPYTASTTDVWDVLNDADEDPLAPGKVLEIYKNASYTKAAGGNNNYNREHTWPKSLGFPDDGATNYPHTDTHMLMASDIAYNEARGNLPFGTCPAGSSLYATLAYYGQGGSGHGNYRCNGYWQAWDGIKGNVARAMLYMDVRYDGGVHPGTNHAEPDLRLTDSLSLIAQTSGNASVAYMGLKSTILQWHRDDPVDERERLRNDIVESYQGNRNPFVDHPEWAACIFQNVCN